MNQHRGELALLDYLDRLLQPQTVQPERPHAEPEPPPPSLLPLNRVKLQQLLDQVSEPPVAPVTVMTPTAELPPTPSVAASVSVTSAPVTVKVTATTETAQTTTEAVAETLTGYSNVQYRSELPARFQTLIFRIDEL